MAAQKRTRRQQGCLPLLPIVALVVTIATSAVGFWLWSWEGFPPGKQAEPPPWIEQALLTENPYSRPTTPLEEINGIVLHYVGNPATSAQANRNYFEGLQTGEEGTYASSHFIVGLEGEILQCVPLTEISYCSNSRNDDTIAIEICHDDETGEFSPATLAGVVKLTAWLCAELDLTTEQVIRHYDVTGKVCPKFYVESEAAWESLLAGVDAQLQAGVEK